MHYLKQGHGLITLPEPLNPELYNNIGATPADYHRSYFIPLTDEQVAFREANPSASIAEILAMALTPPPEPTLDDLRAEKLAALDEHDTSPAVNSFTFQGRQMWLDKATRVGLANSIAIEADAGRTQTRLWFDGALYTLPITAARQMLAALELYALDCYNVTASHRAAILALDTPQAIADYDITASYPSPLNLDTL